MKKSEFLEIFDQDLFLLEQKARSKNGALEGLVDHLFANKRVNSKQAVLNTILTREKMASTGIGKGVAIPHARSMMVDRLTVLFARFDKGIKFDSVDKKPVHFVFLILAPPQDVGNQYLPFIGKLVELTAEKKNRDALMAVTDFDQFRTVVRKAL